MHTPICKQNITRGLGVAVAIHILAILARELFPLSVVAPIAEFIAMHSIAIYLGSIIISLVSGGVQTKQELICIAGIFTTKTMDGLKKIMIVEFSALGIVLAILPTIAWFYSQVHRYLAADRPSLHRFLDYIPLADVLHNAPSSFPFFVTSFAIASILCFIIPHTYLAYRYAKRSPSPINSAISFSILLSAVVTLFLVGLLALNLDAWMMVLLLLIGPVMLIAFIIINVILLRYHEQFIAFDREWR